MTDRSDTERNRYRITVIDGSNIDDFGALSDELGAFWTFGATVRSAEFVVTADAGFAAEFETETELEGVVIEEMAE